MKEIVSKTLNDKKDTEAKKNKRLADILNKIKYRGKDKVTPEFIAKAKRIAKKKLNIQVPNVTCNQCSSQMSKGCFYTKSNNSQLVIPVCINPICPNYALLQMNKEFMTEAIKNFKVN